jgi:hypothetical protein
VDKGKVRSNIGAKMTNTKEKQESQITSGNIYQKLAEVKKYIRTNPVEKKGYNKHSKYKYFEPEQIDNIVAEACEKFGLTTIFSFCEKSIGIIEKSTKIFKPIDVKLDRDIWDLIKKGKDTPNLIKKEVERVKAVFIAKLKIIDITWVFDISENGLDFDTTENTERQYNSQNEYKKEPPQKRQETQKTQPKQNQEPSFSDLENINNPDPNQYYSEAEKRGEPRNLYPKNEPAKKDNDSKYHQQVKEMLLDRFPNEVERLDYLERITSFTNQDGKLITGLREVGKLTLGRAKVTRDKIKNEFNIK